MLKLKQEDNIGMKQILLNWGSAFDRFSLCYLSFL